MAPSGIRFERQEGCPWMVEGLAPASSYLTLDFPLGLEGLLTNPGTPGGKDGGEANPTELHEGVQGAGSEAAAGRRQGAVGGSDGTWHWHRAAQPVAHRAPGGRLGRGTGRPQGGAGGNAATEARGEAARRGGGDPPRRRLFSPGGSRDEVRLRIGRAGESRRGHAVPSHRCERQRVLRLAPRGPPPPERGGGVTRAARADRPRLRRPPAGLRRATRPRRATPGRAAAFAPARRAADAREGALGPPGPPPSPPNHGQPP